DRARGFDFARDVLLRVAVFRTADTTYDIVWSFHHLLLDGWSGAVLTAELETIYAALVAGEIPALPAPTPYRRYLQWIAEQDRSASAQHWAETLAGYEAVASLPAEGHASGPAGRKNVRSWRFGPDVTRSLEAWARDSGVTVGTALQALWGVLLGRQLGRTDVVFGTTVAGRPAELPGVERMLGLFINTLPARVRWEDHEPLREVARRVQAAAVAGEAHAYTPLWEIQSASPLHGPLFDHVLIVENYPLGRGVQEGLAAQWTVEAVDTIEEMHYTLGLVVTQEADGLCLQVSHDPAIYPAAQVERLFGRWSALLAGLRVAPDARPGDLDILPPAERDTVLVSFNRTRRDRETGATLTEFIEAQAARSPEAMAVSDDERAMSYAELHREANRLAHFLRAKGIGPDSRVGVCLERSVDMMTALLAALKAGACYVPLDPDLPDERLAYLLRDSACAWLLTVSRLGSRCAATGVPRFEFDRPASELAVMDTGNLPPLGGSDNLAYVIYTSGSTGEPKGAEITNGALLNHMQWFQEAFDFDASDRVLQKTPFGFDASVWEFYAPLLCGGRLVMARPGGHRDAAYLEAVLREQGITTLQLVPLQFAMLLREDAFSRLPQVKRVFVGGEALPPDLRDRFLATSSAGLYNLYGPAEACIDATWWACNQRDDEGPIPIGPPIDNVTAYVFDEMLRPAPIGVWGELYLGGGGVARGYAGEPALTAARFVPDPAGATPGARVYRTGDRARWRADGALEYGGRLDRQVKVRGQRVEPDEVEAALRQCAGVRDAAVVPQRGPGGTELVAYLVCETPAPTRDAVRTALSARVPAALVPGRFTVVARLPLTASGKVDRRALAGLAGRSLDRGRETRAPWPGAETVLAGIWTGVLGVEAVGREDEFFALGGDSIKALQVVARARTAGLGLTVADVFAQPALRGLAAAARPLAAAVRDQGEVTGTAGLGPMQAWLLTGPGPHAHFNQSLVLHWRGRVDVARLRAAVQAVVAQHDALRLTVTRDAAGRWQQVQPGRGSAVTVETWALEGDAARAAAAREAAATRLQAGFELGTGPLFKVAVAQLAEEDQVVLVAHHLVIDGVSWRIVLEDLATAYAAAALDAAPVVPVLPAKTDAYLRWVRVVHEDAASAARQAELPYWTSVCRTETTLLPRDDEADEGGTVQVRLTREETTRLLGEAHRAYGTDANDLLLAGLGRALQHWHGGTRTLVALEGHGREPIADLDVSRTVGWFTSLYPVVLEVADAGERTGDAAWSWQIRYTKEALRQVPQRGIGYGILRYARPDGRADPALACTPDVVFNYLGSFDTADPAAPFVLGFEGAGPDVLPPGHRSAPLTVTGVVVDGALELSATCLRGHFRRERVAAWLAQYRTSLQQIADHCMGRAPEVTPGDLTLRGLDLAAYEALLDRHDVEPAAIEDICPLAPLQQGLLFHALAAPGTTAYVEQTAYRLQGALDPVRFEAAWQMLLDRHANLRVAIWTQGVDRPVQVIPRHRRIEYRDEDWRGRPAAEQRAH
ncbi:MAG TPA: amino acid adenylation domain-containing protein, partial [Vicinamibacterales bacterium]|nr:amino acid adenylation domain-containing protein [Vicinamibacterales bacterium]